MKQWNKPDIELLDLSSTANGKHTNKFEGIDGVDATGEYNKYINKNGTGQFVVPTNDDTTGDDDVVNQNS